MNDSVKKVGLILVIVVALGIAGYFAFQNFSPSAQEGSIKIVGDLDDSMDKENIMREDDAVSDREFGGGQGQQGEQLGETVDLSGN